MSQMKLLEIANKNIMHITSMWNVEWPFNNLVGGAYLHAIHHTQHQIKICIKIYG